MEVLTKLPMSYPVIEIHPLKEIVLFILVLHGEPIAEMNIQVLSCTIAEMYLVMLD
jgi:hypothetical protein